MLESKGCRIRTSCEVHKVSTNDEGECLKLSDQTSFSFLLVLNEHALSNLLMTHSYNLIVLIFYMNYTRFHSSLWRWVWGNIQWMHNGCPRPRRRENIRRPGNIRWTESTWCFPICVQVNFSCLIWGNGLHTAHSVDPELFVQLSVGSDIFLHRDKDLMPQNPAAWSAWNFLGSTDNKVCLTYWLNVLQVNDVLNI